MSVEDAVFRSPWTHFEGLGFSPTIPPYLRATGWIRNIQLNKRDTEKTVNELWIERERELAVRAAAMTVAARVQKENQLISTAAVVGSGTSSSTEAAALAAVFANAAAATMNGTGLVLG